MDCRLCLGSGHRTVRLGRPDPDRDTHAPYRGPWCIVYDGPCRKCVGTGVEPFRKNRMAGLRIRLDANGRPYRQERLGDPVITGSEETKWL